MSGTLDLMPEHRPGQAELVRLINPIIEGRDLIDVFGAFLVIMASETLVQVATVEKADCVADSMLVDMKAAIRAVYEMKHRTLS